MDYPFNPSIQQKRPSIYKPTLQDEIEQKLLVEKFLSTNKQRTQFKSNAPIIWERLSSGCRIIDFQIERIDEILEHIKMYYFCSEQSPLATSLFINSYTMRKYLEFIFDVVSEQNSFCAIEEGSGKIIGVAIASINCPFDETMENNNFSWNIDHFNLLNYARDLLIEANIYETFGIDKYLCIHIICVHPEYSGNGIGTALVQACIIKAQQNLCSLCIGIFPAGSSYTIAKKLNFKNLSATPWMNIKLVKSNDSDTNVFAKNSVVMCMGITISVEEDDTILSKETIN